MNIFTKACLLPIIFTLFTNNILANENNKIENSHYDELCGIYKNIVNKSVNLSEKEMKLTENVQDKLPALFNQLFVHIIISNADSRYRLIQQYAKQQNNITWECEAARLYYVNEFGTH